MPTDLIWFAVGLGDKLNQSLVPWKCPLKWGSKNREWIFDKNYTVRKYFWWYVVVYGLIFSWVCGGFVYLLYGKLVLKKTDVSIPILFQFGILAMMNSLVTGLATQLSVVGKRSVTLFNAFTKYHERVVRKMSSDMQGKTKKKRKKPQNWFDKAAKSLGFNIPSCKRDDGKLDYNGTMYIYEQFNQFRGLNPLDFVPFQDSAFFFACLPTNCGCLSVGAC